MLGVRYDPTQPMIVRETVAHLIFGDSASWEAVRAMRNKKMGLLRGMSYVLMLSLRNIPAVIKVLANEPARLKRVAARERDAEREVSEPAHVLAFGEAFDPVPSRPISLLRAAIERNEGAAAVPPLAAPVGELTVVPARAAAGAAPIVPPRAGGPVSAGRPVQGATLRPAPGPYEGVTR